MSLTSAITFSKERWVYFRNILRCTRPGRTNSKSALIWFVFLGADFPLAQKNCWTSADRVCKDNPGGHQITDSKVCEKNPGVSSYYCWCFSISEKAIISLFDLFSLLSFNWLFIYWCSLTPIKRNGLFWGICSLSMSNNQQVSSVFVVLVWVYLSISTYLFVTSCLLIDWAEYGY